MGKRVRKKRQGSAKQKQVTTNSPKKLTQLCNLTVDSVNDGVSLAKEIKYCPHLEKGVNLNKLSNKIRSLRSKGIMCEDCREGAADRRGNKRKGKHGNKKVAADSKSGSKAIWVCLECGQYTCGGVGLPVTPQCHAIKHARQSQHPLVVNFDKLQLCWCFACNMLIPDEKIEQNDETNHVLSDVVTLLKGRSSEQSSVAVQDILLGDGSVTSEVKSGSLLVSDSTGKGGYIVRGMANLGNTCFFNSITQNLLAMDRLRGNFLKLDAPFGPLTSSLKKLFTETNSESGLKNFIYPKSFFSCVCSKSPQLRGYQQHDSHELFCCLLDGLSNEELAARKWDDSPKKDGTSSSISTLVDALFGGRLSSTVCCLECGHSSMVYEPFLDLSLPVPSKKPPARKAQVASRSKKTKLPLKKGGRTRVKVNRDAGPVPVQSLSTQLSSYESSCPVQSNISVAEEVVATSDDSTVLGSEKKSNLADQEDSTSPNILAVQDSKHMHVLDNRSEKKSTSLGDFAWLDYVEAGTMADKGGFFSQKKDVTVIQDAESKDESLNESPLQASCESSGQNCFLDEEGNLRPDTLSMNGWEDEVPVQVQDSEVLLLPYKEESSSTPEIMGRDGEAMSSVLGCGQEDLGFDGFGDLFDEPEIVAGPAPRPSCSEVVDAGNSSESDPDEVDDTDSRVSVESYLAHFIKPELLSNENAWHCENCLKILRHKKLEVKMKKKRVSNGEETGSSGNTWRVANSCPAAFRSLDNGNIKNDQIRESLVSHVKYCTELENSQTDELNTIGHQGENKTLKMNGTHNEESLGFHEIGSEESYDRLSADSCGIQNITENVHRRDSQFFNHEKNNSEINKDEEVDTESVKVKRDATKRVLINKAPSVLAIHLKRFSQDIRGRLSKLNGHVSFRETIDLRPYMDARCINEEECEYHLVGVVEHLGTMRGGHYVAYVRGSQRNRGKAEKENESST